MLPAYKHLVKFCLNKGHIISVYDGGDWPVVRSDRYRDIIEAIEAVEEASIYIRLSDSEHLLGTAYVIPFGLEPDETVVDYSGEFMDAWNESYDSFCLE